MSLEWSTLDNCFNSPLTGDNGGFPSQDEVGGDTSKPWLNFNEHQNSYRDDVFSPFFEKKPASSHIPTSKDDLIPKPAQTNSTVVRQMEQDAPTLPSAQKKSSEDILKALNLSSSNPHQATDPPTYSPTIQDSSPAVQKTQQAPQQASLFPIPEGEKRKSTHLRDANPGNMGERPLSTRATFPNHPNNNYQVHVDNATDKVVPNTLSTIPKLRMTRDDLFGDKQSSQTQDDSPPPDLNVIENFQSPYPNGIQAGPLKDQENQDKIWLVVLVIYMGIIGLMLGNNMRR